ncbi:MAG: tetratricopeptide repeat protein [Pseudobacter sp.]|uniref:tetratricopeptide repeat protein n=1 Tax=Pseudobacter sp. TaxID=2045420 RepID=UPI003F800A3C
MLSNYYYIAVGLQVICVLHALRRNTHQKWIWLIVFLPVVGALIYIFTEMFSRREVQNVQSNLTHLSNAINPGGRIAKLEERLRFSDTFNNRIELADAYLANKQTGKAIQLYEQSLTGAFTENEHVRGQLAIAYFAQQRYEAVVKTASQLTTLPQFSRSRVHLLYALSLAYTGDEAKAEKEFRLMNGQFANYEARYNYGIFLEKAERKEEAISQFRQILEESTHLSSREKNDNREWFQLSKDALRKLGA